MSSMTTEPLGTPIEEPLARLVAFEPTTFPVLSVYLNTHRISMDKLHCAKSLCVFTYEG